MENKLWPSVGTAVRKQVGSAKHTPNVFRKRTTESKLLRGAWPMPSCRHSGLSVRVANGLYYRFGGMRGHAVESTSLHEVDYGDFLMTTRGIYFSGMEKGINFRLPYNQIIRFQPYSDAVGICRNGGREQIF